LLQGGVSTKQFEKYAQVNLDHFPKFPEIGMKITMFETTT